jgi:hypothetical protein
MKAKPTPPPTAVVCSHQVNQVQQHVASMAAYESRRDAAPHNLPTPLGCTVRLEQTTANWSRSSWVCERNTCLPEGNTAHIDTKPRVEYNQVLEKDDWELIADCLSG